ncbi:hypothetical protein M23134_02412 [Microscilla marina ATCC 23134]|uniref:DUF4476 domain-containing protein n=2 Tax=Microscilla marina TaxID=1027 RepID=A1ZKJ5_MICM2|nr:hypothetical protein M23134_02412 [Microscilla marina ATCC 23134]
MRFSHSCTTQIIPCIRVSDHSIKTRTREIFTCVRVTKSFIKPSLLIPEKQKPFTTMITRCTTIICSLLLLCFSTVFLSSAQAQRRCRQAIPHHLFKQKKCRIQQKRGHQKLQTAQRVARNHCLNSRQVRTIAQVFRKDQNRLAFAKVAFHNTIDRRNFSCVYSTFYQAHFRQKLKRYVRKHGHYSGGKKWCKCGKRSGHYGGCGNGGGKKWCKCGKKSGHYGGCGNNGGKKWCKCGKKSGHYGGCGNGGGGCGSGGHSAGLIGQRGYMEVLHSVQRERFNSSKMSTAKNMFQIKRKMFVVTQIRSIAQEFRFSCDKMTFLKFAYNYTCDKRKYHQLSNMFRFSSDREAFLRYVNSQQRR